MTNFLRKLDPEGFYDKTLLIYSIVSFVGTLFITILNSYSKTSNWSNVLMLLFSVSFGVAIQNFFLVYQFYRKTNKEK